jgi:phosphoribosylformylglycinamidine synthase subunit PurQ / glutaminase
MRWAILQFPGSNCDQDVLHVLKNVLHQEAYYVWHKASDLENADAVIIPGGFSYGDYLRCGAIAKLSPVMQAVKVASQAGKLVLGICNGFQILCEAGLLPGALLRNRDLHFICDHVTLRLETPHSPFTSAYRTGQTLRMPIAHGEGAYYADEATLIELEAHQQVLFRYVDATGNTTPAANPNGAQLHIAGICNQARNVCGLMPHPERACEGVLGSTAGVELFHSMIEKMKHG